MYKDDYVSALGKLAPGEAWKADTLAKMRALEARRADPLSPDAPRPGRREAVPFAVRMRRAALPAAALVMLAVLPMTTLRGCGASGGNMASMAADQSAAYTSFAQDYEEATCDTAAPEAAPQEAAGAQDAPAGGAPAGEAAPQEAGGTPSAAAALDGQDKTLGAPAGRPYGALMAADLAMASVRFEISDQIVQIDDTEELTALLNDLTLCEQDDSPADRDGEGVVFTLTRADGTQTEFLVDPPFLVIDGVGYCAEAGPCEALDRYARELLERP